MRHQQVDLPLPGRGGTQDKGAGHVGVVTAHQRTEVNLDEIPPLEDCLGGPVVGNGGVRPGGDDRLE